MSPKRLSLNANELCELPTPVLTDIWGPSIREGNLILCEGPRGIGKSRFFMKLAHTIAAGGKFLKWHCEAPRRLLYLDLEMGKFACTRRWDEIERDEDTTSVIGGMLNTLSFDMLDEDSEFLNISYPPDQHRITDEIRTLDAKVLVIDNLLTGSRPINTRDTEITQWQRIEPWLRMLRSEGRTVLLIHHTGKSGTEQLGTSIKEVVMDSHLALRACPIPQQIRGLQFELHFKKTRDFFAMDTPSLQVTYQEDQDKVSRWRWDELGQVRKKEVLGLQARGISKREIASTLGLSLSQVLWYLQEDRYV